MALAFSFLRHVPLARAIIEPSLAAGLTTALVFFATTDVRVVFGLSLLVATLVAIRARRRTNLPFEIARAPANTR
jgi:hypothetical protein